MKTIPRASNPACRRRATMAGPCAPRSPATCGKASTPPGMNWRRSSRRTSPPTGCRSSSNGSSSAPWRSAAPCSAPCCATTLTYFSQLGNFIERADNTARILDVKYFILLPRPSDVGSDLDMQQWAHDPALGFGPPRLSLVLSRQPLQAVAGLGIPDPQGRDAALAGLHLSLDQPRARWSGELYGKRYDCHDAAKKPTTDSRPATWRKSSSPACTSSCDFMAANNRLVGRIATDL